MSETTKASITISYNLKEEDPADADAGDGAQIWIQMDDEKNTPAGEDGPISRFVFGSPAYFIVFHTANIESVQVTPSEGSVAGGGARSVTMKDQITFAGTKTGSLSIPPSGGISTSWRGQGSAPAVSVQGTAITLNREALGTLEVTYTATGLGYSHTMPLPPGYDTEEDPGYSIIILAAE